MQVLEVDPVKRRISLGLKQTMRNPWELFVERYPVAAVVLKPGITAGANELRDWINERVAARYQRVREVVILDAFPRNAAGKTLKREMRDPYWAGRAKQI